MQNNSFKQSFIVNIYRKGMNMSKDTDFELELKQT